MEMAAIEADEFKDCIEACRTCGVFFLTTSNFLRQIFTSAMDDPEMNLIRMELLAWNVEVNQNDGFPQYICTGCILDFQKVFKFRRSCIEMQQQLRHFYNLRQANATSDFIQVKTELPDPDEADGDNECDFIYVDDVSDGEYDGTTPFTIPHAPIKEERIEEATVPPTMEDNSEESFESTRCSTVEIIPAAQQEEMMSPPPSPLLTPPEETAQLSFLIEAVQDQPQQDAFRLVPLVAAPLTASALAKRSIHENIKDLECHICGKEFKNSTASRLKFHLKWHKISKHIKCVQCGFYCGSRVTMREHTRAVHASSKCTVCGKLVFANKMKNHMRGHQQASHGVEEEKRVEESFSSGSHSQQHTRVLHPYESSSNISNPDAMETSANESATAYEIMCSHCTLKFAQRSELELHWKEAHHSTAILNDSKPSATTAADDFKFEAVKSAEGAEEESNRICLNNFDAPTTDSMHEEGNVNNTNETSALRSSAYSCNQEESGATFQENNLRSLAHDFTTNPEKQDDREDDSSNEANDDDDAKSSDMETGSMTTLPPTPAAAAADGDKIHSYVCAECTQSFASIAALCAHHEAHVQKPKFSCHICGKSFDLKFSLNRHLKKHVKAPF